MLFSIIYLGESILNVVFGNRHCFFFKFYYYVCVLNSCFSGVHEKNHLCSCNENECIFLEATELLMGRVTILPGN